MARPAEFRDNLSMAKSTVVSRLKPPRRRLFLKEWRRYRGMTQEALADAAGMSIGNVNHLEQAKQNYTQEALEALAGALRCEPAHLIMVDPTKDDAMWSVWERAKPAQRAQIVEVAKTLIKTGT